MNTFIKSTFMCGVTLLLLSACSSEQGNLKQEGVQGSGNTQVENTKSTSITEEKMLEMMQELNLIGMTEQEAQAKTTSSGYPFRVVVRDGEALMTTKDFRVGRVNATLENESIVSYTIEGYTPTGDQGGQGYDDVQ